MEAIRRISGHTFDEIRAMGPVNAERLCIASYNRLMQSINKNDCKTYTTVYKHLIAAASASSYSSDVQTITPPSAGTQISDESSEDERAIVRPEVRTNKRRNIVRRLQ